MISITRDVEFDAGHRVPDHMSKCRHPHGHRYKLTVTVQGLVKEQRGESEDGMICDFGILGDLLGKLADEYDHAFLVAAHDHVMVEFLERQQYAHVVVTEGPPTAEVLVQRMVRTLDMQLPVGTTLIEAILWETPKCRATYSR